MPGYLSCRARGASGRVPLFIKHSTDARDSKTDHSRRTGMVLRKSATLVGLACQSDEPNLPYYRVSILVNHGVVSDVVVDHLTHGTMLTELHVYSMHPQSLVDGIRSRLDDVL